MFGGHAAALAITGPCGHAPCRYVARIALVPQIPQIPAGMSVAHYVLLGRTPHLRIWPAFGGTLWPRPWGRGWPAARRAFCGARPRAGCRRAQPEPMWSALALVSDDHSKSAVQFVEVQEMAVPSIPPSGADVVSEARQPTLQGRGVNLA